MITIPPALESAFRAYLSVEQNCLRSQTVVTKSLPALRERLEAFLEADELLSSSEWRDTRDAIVEVALAALHQYLPAEARPFSHQKTEAYRMFYRELRTFVMSLTRKQLSSLVDPESMKFPVDGNVEIIAIMDADVNQEVLEGVADWLRTKITL
jgi:gamma-glutamyl:cysteine ligase YbdK (ATP-grasp superfamily)